MATLKLNVDTTKGIGFTGNSLTIKTASLVEKRTNGLYVPSLKGPNGTSGGSAVDGYTIIDNNTKPIINRSNVVMIFAMGTKSSISEIINECNIACNKGSNYTQYLMRKNDIFMFRRDKIPGYVGPNVYGGDDGNRYPYDSSECKALFVIKAISYSTGNYSNKMTSLKMVCLWSNVSGWTKGSIYST